MWDPWKHPFDTTVTVDGAARALQIARLSVGQKAAFRAGFFRLMQPATWDGQQLQPEEAVSLLALPAQCRAAAEQLSDEELVKAVRAAGAAVETLVQHRQRLELALDAARLDRQREREAWEVEDDRRTARLGDWINDTIRQYVRIPAPWLSTEGIEVVTAEDFLHAYQVDEVLQQVIFAIWRYAELPASFRKNWPSPSDSSSSSPAGTADRTGSAPGPTAAVAAGSASAPSDAATGASSGPPMAASCPSGGTETPKPRSVPSGP